MTDKKTFTIKELENFLKEVLGCLRHEHDLLMKRIETAFNELLKSTNLSENSNSKGCKEEIVVGHDWNTGAEKIVNCGIVNCGNGDYICDECLKQNKQEEKGK